MPANRPAPWSHNNTIITVPVDPFSPGDLSGLVAWYDAKDIVGVADGGSVNSWPDASGNGRSLGQSGANVVPLYKSNVVSGGPAVLFDGSTTTLQANMSGVTLTPPFTVICVARQTTNTGAPAKIWDFTSGTNEWGFGNNPVNNGPPIAFYVTGPAGFGYQPTTIPPTDVTWRIWASELHPNTPWTRTQGRLDSTASNSWSGLSFANGFLNIGSRIGTQQPWNGYVMAVLVFNRALTPWEHHRISQYYAPRIGITYTPHLPTDVTGLKCWVAADQIIGLKDGSLVSQWNDLSGNANHLIQATQNRQPTYWTKALQGFPSVRFDGVNDYMVANFTLAQPLSFFGIAALTATPAQDKNVLSGPAGALGTDCTAFVRSTGLTTGLYAGLIIDSSGTMPVDTPTAISAIFNGASSTLVTNGSSRADGNASINPASGLLLGAQNTLALFTAAEYLDAIAYNKATSDLERLVVEDYMRRRILI